MPSNLISLAIDDSKKLISNRLEWGLQRLQSLKLLWLLNSDFDCWDEESFLDKYFSFSSLCHFAFLFFFWRCRWNISSYLVLDYVTTWFEIFMRKGSHKFYFVLCYVTPVLDSCDHCRIMFLSAGDFLNSSLLCTF